MTDQLARLVKPFAPHLIHTNPSGGGSYVSHSAVTEKLLAVVGPYSWEKVEVIWGDVAGRAPNPQGSSDRARKGTPDLTHVIVGYIGRLTVTVDGRTVSVEEIGDCEEPHNWKTDGARLKDAMSDSLKRCAMRLGVGLHMWSQFQGKSEFFIYDYLSKDGGPALGGDAGTEGEREDADNGGALVASPSAASTAPPASLDSDSSGPSPATPPPLSAGEGPSLTANRARLTQAVKDRHLSEAKKQQFRAELISRGLPQSVKDMDEDQARDALGVLNEKFPEEMFEEET